MLDVVMVSVVMLNVVMVNVVMLNVVMLSVVMLNVVAPIFFLQKEKLTQCLQHYYNQNNETKHNC